MEGESVSDSTLGSVLSDLFHRRDTSLHSALSSQLWEGGLRMVGAERSGELWLCYGVCFLK